LWADLKAWLLDNVFHGKCAYCEVAISGGFFGEGEHYRPKGKVAVLKSGKKTAVTVGAAVHPGYFWLVYEWKNLVPARQECNNRKSDLFPTAQVHVGVPSPSCEQLDLQEEPLLLHPYRDDPRKYLVFGINGVIAACGFRGLRPGFPIERDHAFRSKAATCSDEGDRGVVAGMRSGVRFFWLRQVWRAAQ